MGGTMRLGLWACALQDGSLAAAAYAPAPVVRERHRHRWEFNNRYRPAATRPGCISAASRPTAGWWRSPSWIAA